MFLARLAAKRRKQTLVPGGSRTDRGNATGIMNASVNESQHFSPVARWPQWVSRGGRNFH